MRDKKDVERLLADPAYKDNKFLKVHLEAAIKKLQNELNRPIKKGP